MAIVLRDDKCLERSDILRWRAFFILELTRA
jgi:hypothetical protein